MRWIRRFDEGSAQDRELPDVKGANLAEMARERLLAAATYWSEDDPMLGIRGVRLGVIRPRAVPHTGPHARRGRRPGSRPW